MTRGIQDCRNAGLGGCRTRGIQEKRVQDRSDAGQEGHCTAGMQDRWFARSGGIQDRKDAG